MASLQEMERWEGRHAIDWAGLVGFWFERLQQLQQVLAAALIWLSAGALPAPGHQQVQEGLHRLMFCERDMQVAKLVQLQVGLPGQAGPPLAAGDLS
jgi:hypothetical protein